MSHPIPSLSAPEGVCEGGTQWAAGYPHSCQRAGIGQLGGFQTAPFPSSVALGKLLNLLKPTLLVNKRVKIIV